MATFCNFISRINIGNLNITFPFSYIYMLLSYIYSVFRFIWFFLSMSWNRKSNLPVSKSKILNWSEKISTWLFVKPYLRSSGRLWHGSTTIELQSIPSVDSLSLLSLSRFFSIFTDFIFFEASVGTRSHVSDFEPEVFSTRMYKNLFRLSKKNPYAFFDTKWWEPHFFVLKQK